MTVKVEAEGGVPRDVLHDALDELAARDRQLADAIGRVGKPEPRTQRPGFPTLLRVIVGQQLSTKAAASIWERVVALSGSDDVAALTADWVLAQDDAALRGAGLSRPKVRYARALASDLIAGRLDLAALGTLPEEEAIRHLTQVKGFGRWSAEVYLLFAHARADLFPADDLGVQAGLQMLRGLPERPKPKAARALVEHWAPWRGCGAIFLWHYYGRTTMEDRSEHRSEKRKQSA
ncbi:MAG: DNA-3-methyladenine glycosylase 2 family protein [Alphaproteobacteria bacterium]|nr:DNA-3-methyladenine glycosylase 2 family protein [Alphaproteobacteria bacterium]